MQILLMKCDAEMKNSFLTIVQNDEISLTSSVLHYNMNHRLTFLIIYSPHGDRLWPF